MTCDKRFTATSASQSDSEEPTRVTTRSKNKTSTRVLRLESARLGRKARDEIQEAKAAKEAAREQVRVENEEKDAAAIAKIAAIKQKQETLASKKRAAPTVLHAIPSSDPLFESESSTVEFVQDGVTPTEGETEDIDVERPKKRGRKDKHSIRKAINHAKEAMEVNHGEETLEIPRPAKRTHKLAQSSDVEQPPRKKATERSAPTSLPYR
ncbi:hypothetical protein BJV77DRAFT_1160214 [Russula vinacea]|nr:hypothetical protein BJV77DRAFT_1160214 [Russula vinacea]